MTFDTQLSMTTHKMGEYWFSEVKFQCSRNTSGIAVKLLKWTRDVGVVTRNVVFVGELWRTSYTKKKPIYLSCSLSDYDEHADLSTGAEDLADTDSEGSVHHLNLVSNHTSTSPSQA